MRLATPGAVLHLGGRNPERLTEVASLCRGNGATVVSRNIDVTDRAAMTEWIKAAGRLDLVIANAGISAGSFGGEAEDAAQVRAIFATNLDGALNTLLPALDAMAQQDARDGWRGQIASVASIAGFIALPHAPSYCAAKAALDRWTVATAPHARRLGVKLVSICPGYVRTPMTATNRFPMPGLMDADRAAELTLRGIASGRERVVFPAWFGWSTRIAGLLPQHWIERATRRVPGKASPI